MSFMSLILMTLFATQFCVKGSLLYFSPACIPAALVSRCSPSGQPSLRAAVDVGDNFDEHVGGPFAMACFASMMSYVFKPHKAAWEVLSSRFTVI